jgi:hypothetical protein
MLLTSSRDAEAAVAFMTDLVRESAAMTTQVKQEGISTPPAAQPGLVPIEPPGDGELCGEVPGEGACGEVRDAVDAPGQAEQSDYAAQVQAVSAVVPLQPPRVSALVLFILVI